MGENWWCKSLCKKTAQLIRGLMFKQIDFKVIVYFQSMMVPCVRIKIIIIIIIAHDGRAKSSF